MKTKTKGIASIIFGIVSFLFISLPWLLILFSILSIIFGFKANKEKQKKLGITGMTLGIISLLLIILYFLSFLIIGNSPLVVFKSCSMYHETSFTSWWEKNSEWYETRGITKEIFAQFNYKNGIKKGDVLFILPTEKIKVGDIIMFNFNSQISIVHRVVSISPYSTKGDRNIKQLTDSNNAGRLDETDIDQNNIAGKVVLRIPYLGWTKLLFSESLRPKATRGFCK